MTGFLALFTTICKDFISLGSYIHSEVKLSYAILIIGGRICLVERRWNNTTWCSEGLEEPNTSDH